MTVKADANPLLTSQPPAFSKDEAVRIALRFFNIETSALPLWSERDQNFHLRTPSGEQFVLKIANALESPAVIDFQTRAFEHIRLSDPELPVPRTIPTLNGDDYCLVGDRNGREHIVRLISWLEGTIIEESRVSPKLLTVVGRTLARLGIALQDFKHSAANHHLLWDLKNAAELQELLPHIDNPELRAMLAVALNAFEVKVLPNIGKLRAQIIHSDLNRGNVLISTETPQRVTGIIDFGDMVDTPLIMDLAIAAAYHLGESGDPLGNSLSFIRGYHEVTPLRLIEATLLFDLMIARLCTSITVQMWRAKLYPENEEYLLIHNERLSKTLANVTYGHKEESQNRILKLCGYG